MPPEAATQEVDNRLDALAGRPRVAAAVDFIRRRDEETLADQIAISEVPAPSFQEEARAAHVADLLMGAGLEAVRIDATGNVIAERPAAGQRGDEVGEGAGGGAPPIVMAAHLDTVFPAGTDVRVRREGSLLQGPGISDDARGLAALVMLARALDAAELTTRAPLMLVATVGEEGAGDLHGVKALFSQTGAARGAAAFISLDGAGIQRIVAKGLGSRRFRLTVRGPGGHSWVDWGTPNPAHALMSLGSRLARMRLDDRPRTTLSIARLGGGKSINAIPQTAWLEIDTRSADNDRLESLEKAVRGIVAAEREAHPGLGYDIERIGNRPGGATDRSSVLVQAALAATRRLGAQPAIARSSTDANVPMMLGVPAITLGCGGEADNAHTTEEWYRNTDGPDGIVRALYVLLLVAGLAED